MINNSIQEKTGIYIYGKGSKYGWSIKAPKPNPNGLNRNVDISEINWSGKGMGGTYLKTYFGKNSQIVRLHTVLEGIAKGVRAKNKIKSVGGGGYSRYNRGDSLKVCKAGYCGDTLRLNDPNGYHMEFDTIIKE